MGIPPLRAGDSGGKQDARGAAVGMTALRNLRQRWDIKGEPLGEPP